jgi:pyridoxal phosphate enzyme (YggS family)
MGEPSPSSADMKIPINPSRASDLAANLSSVLSRIRSSSKSSTPFPRLVAVSKLKPASDILALHCPPTSHLHFGENYVQELLEKSKILPPEIRWHFIGGLQSNKCKQLARDCPNLWAVESVDSLKKATELEKGRAEAAADAATEPLRVFVQINTSGEESKSGVDPTSPDLLKLCKHISGDECPHLMLQGLMTIGAIARSQATTPETENEDFETLRRVRDQLAGDLGMEAKQLELSMGMSEDFEAAIKQGSDEVRVGSTIFGERPPRKEAKVLEEVEGGKK